MKRDPKEHVQHVSRRHLLKAAGTVVGAAVTPAPGMMRQTDDPARSLRDTEFEILDAICRRIIPADANGPGAGEAQAVRFIDRALGGALSGSKELYAEGLAALDAYAEGTYGTGFSSLPDEEQDRVLAAAEDNAIDGFNGSSAQFFNMVRSHTIQGTFSDPYYGGNANFVGWDMIGYPGVRTAVSLEYQQTGEDHPPNHASVYDFTMFDEGDI